MTPEQQRAYDEALEKIEAVHRTRGTTLSLDNNQLSTLPPEIGQLANLTTLFLANNQLSTLPPEIGQLANLTTLFLANNQLSTLPPEIGQLANLTTLFLANNQLSTLPPEIGQLANLTTLFLANNQLSTLPPEIGQLANLTTLFLANNQLSTLPPEIGQLANLTTLFLANNQLSTLPPEIGQLANLTTLFLANNQLSTLPPEIGQLANLTTLFLANNQLSTLPPEIGQLANLTTLFLANNQLSTLPPEIGQLANLTTLFLANNQLSTLPPEIGQLANLTTLFLANNQLSTLPPEIGQLANLTALSLANNQLSTLPPEIGQLANLTELYIHNNAALAFPDSILGPTYFEVHGPDKKAAARPEDILNFYFAQRQGAATGTLRAVNEIKVMLVGRGGAGKTSLRRFFMGEPHDKAEPETPGIALDSFRLGCAQSEMTVRLWDFAGQEITHALHQFFLTEGCVYVLVLDPRSNTEMQDAEYWLGLLKRYAGGAPVLVALNRQDARQGGYDVDRRVLQERFPFVQSFTPTNCEKREGCAELQEKLCNAVESLKDTEPPKLKVPETWLKVKEDCTATGRPKPQPTGNKLTRWLGLAGHAVPTAIEQQHLTLEQFREICAKRGEKDPAKQESLARLLHKLGAVLRFVDEGRLRDTTVLDPHWVTDGVYRLLRFKDRPGSDGTLTLAEALEALPGETEETARFLLRLMERFEMCFPLDEEEGGKLPTSWLIPGALEEFQPRGVTTDWQKPGSVRLRYLYDPLPEGVLPRFIVLTHLLSEGKPRWRHGVVLEDGQAAALVRRGEKRNHVEVTAFGPGPERLRLLEIIQGNLERIHSDMPGPETSRRGNRRACLNLPPRGRPLRRLSPGRRCL
jgi:internalin A